MSRYFTVVKRRAWNKESELQQREESDDRQAGFMKKYTFKKTLTLNLNMRTFLLIFSFTDKDAAAPLKQIICQRKRAMETLSQKAGLKSEKKSWCLAEVPDEGSASLVWSGHGDPSTKPKHYSCPQRLSPYLNCSDSMTPFPPCIQQEQLPPEKSSTKKILGWLDRLRPPVILTSHFCKLSRILLTSAGTRWTPFERTVSECQTPAFPKLAW